MRMAEISASVNEHEIAAINKDFYGEGGTSGVDPADNVEVMASTCESTIPSEQMDYQSAQNKRPSEDADAVDPPNRKYKLTNINKDRDLDLLVLPTSQDYAAAQALTSQDNNSQAQKVILIKPTSDDAKSVINNPLEIVSVIKQSKCG